MKTQSALLLNRAPRVRRDIPSLADMTGYQLACKLRSHSLRGVRLVPLLALAETRSFGSIELTRAAGFIGCLTKPVMPVELNDVLRRLQARDH